jgi:hypothetical protein
VVDEADEAERGRRPHRVLELGRRTEPHRCRRIDEQVQTQILLVDEELDVEAVEAAVDVPVDVAQVIAVTVGAIVGELHGVPAPGAAALALDAAAERAARQERQPLELRQELGRKERVPRVGRHGYRSSSAWK